MSVGRALEQGCVPCHQESDRVGRELQRFRPVVLSAVAVVIATLGVLLTDATPVPAAAPAAAEAKTLEGRPRCVYY